MTGTRTSAPAARSARRVVGAAVTGLVAAVLTVLSWPVGVIVAGVFWALAAVWCRHWPRAVRLTVLVVGAGAALGTALVLADFATGTASAP